MLAITYSNSVIQVHTCMRVQLKGRASGLIWCIILHSVCTLRLELVMRYEHILQSITFKVGSTTWRRNMLLLSNFSRKQKLLMDTPNRIQSPIIRNNLVLPNQVHSRKIITNFPHNPLIFLREKKDLMLTYLGGMYM